MVEYEHIVVEQGDGIAVVRLNRPKVLNALSTPLMTELVEALEALDADDTVRCIVLTGNERAFAAGADIGEMADVSAVEMLKRNQFARWERIRKVRKPLIAAVSGYALGGGCELAMMCDMIVASESARFGQPEILIGIIPGAGGTQRLTRAVGKALAMEMVLTGRQITAREAFAAGLVNRVVPTELCLESAMHLAKEVAARPPLAVMMGKDAVLKTYDMTLEAGLDAERKNFFLLFSTEDMREGMAAFLEKRPPRWKGK
ncbi:MAG: enoyl-CoA hydratase/isomerase family protein [Thermomicrobia bacterium]|nr:enoyl-CoA hydratase/isomerase family protein [Thermomicrobia bacterium]